MLPCALPAEFTPAPSQLSSPESQASGEDGAHGPLWSGDPSMKATTLIMLTLLLLNLAYSAQNHVLILWLPRNVIFSGYWYSEWKSRANLAKHRTKPLTLCNMKHFCLRKEIVLVPVII